MAAGVYSSANRPSGAIDCSQHGQRCYSMSRYDIAMVLVVVMVIVAFLVILLLIVAQSG